jgi:glycosyltransferase involved in cell wall biosynthesis
MNKISVILITKDEEFNIRDCLESIKWADEIIVVDSISQDSTVKIAKEYTEKVFIKEWMGFADQKKYALSLASNEWVLSIDADERVTNKLKDELLNNNLENVDGYFILRENYFLGKKVNCCGWGSDYQLRLFKKSKTSVTNRLVHEGFTVNGKTERLQNSMTHFSYRNLNDAFKKINVYSSLSAKEKSLKKKANCISAVVHPMAAFIQYYFLRGGFRDGVHGLLISLMHAATNLLTYMKILEIQRIKVEK